MTTGAIQIQSNEAVSASGFVVYSRLETRDVTLTVNVRTAPTGTTPTLTYTLQELDPGDYQTAVGTPLTTPVLTNVGFSTLTLRTRTGAVRVTWTVGGTNPVFPRVYTTLVSTTSEGIAGYSATDGLPRGVRVDDAGRVSTYLEAPIQANVTNASLPVTGTVSANVTNASLPVTGSVTVANTPASPIPTTLTNSSLPVTGSVSITNSSLPVTGSVSITNSSLPVTGTVSANITNASLPITGSVTIANTPASPVPTTLTNSSVPVTGSVSITNSSFPVTGSVSITNSSLPVTGSVTVANTAASPIPTTLTNSSIPVTGTVSISNSSLAVTGTVSANITNTSIPVTGTVNVGNTVPVSGTVSANITNASLPVTGAVNANITNTNLAVQANITNTAVPVSGSVSITNASLPVTGTVNANITNASLPVTGTVNSNITNSSLTVAGTVNATVVNTGSNPVPVSGNLTATLAGVLPRPKEDASYMVSVNDVSLAYNKSLLSIYNSSATSVIRVHAVWLVNVRTGAITGLVGEFELRRFMVVTTPTGGTDLSSLGVEVLDTIDTAPPVPGMSVRTGATITGESVRTLYRTLWSTDEWSAGSVDQEGYDHAVQVFSPLWGKGNPTTKPLVLRQYQGLTVKCVTLSAVGTWDVFALVTVE